MANSYVDSFGMTHYLGVGSGRDELYDASAKPAEGMTNFIEVIVDDKGPLPNEGTAYGRGQACLPKGAVVVSGKLLVEKKGSAASVTLSLVKKDGSDAVALLASTTPSADNTVANCTGAAIGTRLAEDRYVKVGGTTTGLKALLKLEYI